MNGIFGQIGLGAWITSNPTVTSLTGTLGSASCEFAYLRVGKTTYWRADVTVTTNGTGATDLRFTSPIVAKHNAPMIGYEDAQVGKAVVGSFFSGSVCAFRFVDGTYPGVDGGQYHFSGVFEVS